MGRRKSVATLVAACAALTLGVGATTAPAQEPEGAPPAPLPAGSQMVVAPRDVRMSRVGVVRLLVGCLGPSGDVCVGRIEARLARPVTAPTSPGASKNRRWGPFLLGRASVGLGVSRARTVYLRFNHPGWLLVRSAKSIPVDFVAIYNSRQRTGLRTVRTLHAYVP